MTGSPATYRVADSSDDRKMRISSGLAPPIVRVERNSFRSALSVAPVTLIHFAPVPVGNPGASELEDRPVF